MSSNNGKTFAHGIHPPEAKDDTAGLAAELHDQHLHFQANTIRNRSVLSRFQLGRIILSTHSNYRPKKSHIAAAFRHLKQLCDVLICGGP